jgi:hypothetical protein
MAKKFLLVGLNTSRKEGDKNKRVRLAAKQTHDLTADEIKLLDRLTAKTGKLHYRDPVNESAGSNDDDSGEDERSEAEIFVDRPVGEISDDEINALSADARAAALAAQEAGKNRSTLVARLQPVDPDAGL